MAKVKTIKIKKDKSELEVSEKAYEVVYAGLGYKVVENKKKKEDK